MTTTITIHGESATEALRELGDLAAGLLPPVITGAPGLEAQLPAVLATMPPTPSKVIDGLEQAVKRTRRTKAEMEAARAAETAASPTQEDEAGEPDGEAVSEESILSTTTTAADKPGPMDPATEAQIEEVKALSRKLAAMSGGAAKVQEAWGYYQVKKVSEFRAQQVAGVLRDMQQMIDEGGA